MKLKFKTPFFLLSFILVISVSCSSPILNDENNLEFLNETELNDNTSVYHYRFKFNGSAWMKVSAFVKREEDKYIISINRPADNNLNIYTYTPDTEMNNLDIASRVKKETAANLKEAIKKSIFIYLADNI